VWPLRAVEAPAIEDMSTGLKIAGARAPPNSPLNSSIRPGEAVVNEPAPRPPGWSFAWRYPKVWPKMERSGWDYLFTGSKNRYGRGLTIMRSCESGRRPRHDRWRRAPRPSRGGTEIPRPPSAASTVTLSSATKMLSFSVVVSSRGGSANHFSRER